MSSSNAEKPGIYVPSGYTLTIEGSGSLVAKTAYSSSESFGGAGIGGANGQNCGAGNKLYWPSADRTMNSFRAYFQLNGITAGDVQGGGDSGGLVSISSYVLGFGDDSETTGIIEVEANSSLFTLHSSLSAWYDLQGRKLQGNPSQKGIYINNGRKVVIK